MKKFSIYNRNTGKKLNETFETIQQAIAAANKLNTRINQYNFLVTNIK